MSLLNKIARQTFVYGLGSVLGRTLNFLFVPLYTAIFSPQQYGIITELFVYVAFLNVLYTYGMETTYLRFSSNHKNPESIFNLALVSILASSFLFSSCIYFLSDTLANLLQYPNKGYIIKWLAFILSIDALVALPFVRLRQNNESIKFVSYKLFNVGMNIVLNLTFLAYLPWLSQKNPQNPLLLVYDDSLGIGYVFLSNLIANLFYLIIFLPTWRNIKTRMDVGTWKSMIKYSLPVLIIGFAGVTNEMFSRALLKYRLVENFYPGLTGTEVLGIFGACYKLSVFMTLAIQAFRYAFEPFFFKDTNEQNAKKNLVSIMDGFIFFGACSWVTLSLMLPFIAPILLRQEKYLFALDAVPWLLGGGLWLGIFYNLSVWYKITDRTTYGAVLGIVGVAVTLLLNWYLIPIYGYMGSAVTTFFVYFIITLISYLWGQAFHKVPYHILKNGICIAISIIGIWGNALFSTSKWNTVLILVLCLLLQYVINFKLKLSLK